MDPTLWIINLFSNRDDPKAFYGDSYEIETNDAVHDEYEEEETPIDNIIGEEADLHDEEDTNDEAEDDEEIIAPRFDEDENIDVKDLDDDDDDANGEDDNKANDEDEVESNSNNNIKLRKRAKVVKAPPMKKTAQVKSVNKRATSQKVSNERAPKKQKQK